MDNGAVYFAKNGVWQNSGDPTSGAAKTGAAYTTFEGSYTSVNCGYNGASGSLNFGQQPLLYTPPAGYRTLQTQHLPTLTVTEGFNGFRAVEGPGAGILPIGQGKANGANGATGFTSGLWWIKDTVNSNQWQFLDSVRGSNKAILSPSLGAETDYVPPTGTSISYCWNTPSTTATNTDGTIESTISVNPTTGFSIISFTGNGVAGATVGHGLNTAPTQFWLKPYEVDNSLFYVYDESIGNGSFLYLQSSQPAGADNVIYWNNTSPTDSVITLGTANNSAGTKYIIYAFTPVEGYSSIGSYTGNGNVDGPFIYTGFTPSFVLIKSTTASNGSWVVMDSTRNDFNTVNLALFANLTDTATANVVQMEFLSNGMKMTNATSSHNNAGESYVYMAFASNPSAALMLNQATLL